MRLAPTALVAWIALAPLAAAQTTYYVDASATPPGQGTQAEPWTSIQTAIDLAPLTEGDTVLVAPGTYVEALDNTGKSFALVSSGGPLATELRSNGSSSALAIGGGQVALSGFTVAQAPDFVAAIWVLGELTMSECIVRDNLREGVRSAGKVTVDRCTVTRNDEGLRSLAGADWVVRDSIVWGNATWDMALIGGSVFGTYDVRNSLFSWSKSTVGPGGGTLMNNKHRDPRWWDPAADDFFLRPRSVCVGAGIDGGDMGAVPYDSGHAPEAPTTYCLSKPNSLGCVPAIGSTGTPSAGGGVFDVTLTDTLNNKQGLLFYGYRAKHSVYQGGWLCVQAPVVRTPVQSSNGNPPPDDCSGTYTFDFGGWIAGGSDPGLTVGAAVFAQWWYRDPNDPTGFTTGRSDALAFTIQP